MIWTKEQLIDRLETGRRRLEACRSLGWEKVPVNTVPLRDLVKGEYHENVARKDFTLSESVAIVEAVEPAIKAEAKDRMLNGKPSCKLHKGRSDEAVAKFTGRKRTTLRKGKAIVEAARKDPDKFGYPRKSEGD